jgi:Alw26I/Eco31I/Esp3I family type II restriction m6 adenine DNA methyltransferase
MHKSLNLLSSEGKLLSIVPSQMWGDNVSQKLRNWILKNFNLLEIHFLNENEHCFQNKSRKVSQSFSYFLLQRRKDKNSEIQIYLPGNMTIKLKQSFIINSSNFSIIPKASNEEMKILKTIRESFPTIGDLSFIFNSRGEVDVTKFKKFFKEKTALEKTESYLPLVRGKHIKLFTVKDVEEVIPCNYITNFLSKKKISHVYSKRIIGQQISNQNLKKRLKFAIIEKAFVANSCNYLLVDNSCLKAEILLAILNSELIEWYFKKYSYTNHVANYEINNFPIAISNLKEFEKEILEYVSILQRKFDTEIYNKLNHLIYNAYLLGKKEIKLIKERL